MNPRLFFWRKKTINERGERKQYASIIFRHFLKKELLKIRQDKEYPSYPELKNGKYHWQEIVKWRGKLSGKEIKNSVKKMFNFCYLLP